MNIHREPALVQDYHLEYFRLLRYYANLRRQAVFVRYYNIAFEDSSYEPVLESTYDRLGIRFNLYEFTPAFNLTPVLNQSSYAPDLRGQMAEGFSSIVVYTIPRPRIGDVVAFYEPLKEGEYFRVINLKTAVYGLRTDPSVEWFELDLEYAPIKKLDDLTVINRFVYDLAEEAYLPFDRFRGRLETVEEIRRVCREIVSYYDESSDLYRVGEMTPTAPNVLIWLFKAKFQQGFRRLFEELPAPFGYWDVCAIDGSWKSLEEVPLEGPQEVLVHGEIKLIAPEPGKENEAGSLERLLFLCRELRDYGGKLWT